MSRWVVVAVASALASAVCWSSSVAAADIGGQAVAVQNDAAHDGYQPDPELTLPLSELWTVNLGGAVSYPVIVGNVVYVTAGSSLYAINLSTGATLWQKSLSGSTDGGFGQMGPAYDNGQIYVSDDDGNLSALDPSTGLTLWTQGLSSDPPGQTSYSGSPTASAGSVYLAGAGSGGTLRALSEATGDPIWSGSVQNGDGSSPAVSSSGVYVTYACDQDYDFNPASGDLNWHYANGCEGGGGSTPALGNGDLYSVDAVTGNVILSASSGQNLGTFSSSTTPAIADGVLYTMSGGTLEAISDGGLGTVSWSFTGDGHLDTAPLVAGSDVYVGSSSGEVYALDTTTGSTLWSASAGSAVDSTGNQGASGLAVADRSLVVPSGDQLTAFGDTASVTTATTTVTAPSSSVAGQQVTVTAAVAPTDGSGTVTFYVDGAPIDGCSSMSLSTTADQGTATCDTTTLPGGSNTVVAEYTGDSAYTSSLGSATVSITDADYTWAGAAAAGTKWSSGTNWTGGRPPSGTAGTITFPELTSSNCTAATPSEACYTSDNDVAGLTANAIDVDSDSAYDISGDPVTVGAGGVSVSSPSASAAAPKFGLPITLGAPQSWSISQSPVVFSDAVSGAEALGLDFTSDGFIEPSDMEVGDITADGSGGVYLDGGADLNSSDLSQVTLAENAGIEADQTDNSVGPVAVGSGGWISIGGVDNGGGELAAKGLVNFSGSSTLELAVDAPGTQAGTDYSQLTATGNIDLNGAGLDVYQGADIGGYCDDLEPGDKLTLLSTTGTISGTFSNYANGASVDIGNACDGANEDAAGTLSYSTSAVTLTITNSGDAGGAPQELVAPSLSSETAEEGQTLQTSTGSWLGATSFTYSWWACDGSACNEIAGATSATFVPTSAQLGDELYAVVTAIGPGGSNRDDTDNTGPVTAEPIPTISATPTVAGGTTAGDVLSATTGTWSNAPTSYSYQWMRCSSTGSGCAAIGGATTNSYTSSTADVGSTIEVMVTATNYGGSGSAASTPTAVISPAASTTSPATFNNVTPQLSVNSIQSALKTVLRPSGRNATPKELVRLGGYTFTFAAPARGTLTVVWTARVKHKSVTIGRARVTASAGSRVKVRIALTPQGKSDLKRYPQLKIWADSTFTALGLSPLSRSTSFKL